MSTPGWIKYELVEPGYIYMESHGDVDLEETTQLFDFMRENVKDSPFFVIEANMNHIDGMSAAARRVAAERLRQLPNRAIAVVGGSFAQRMIAKLVVTGVAMLDRSGQNVFKFFRDTDSAQTWLRSKLAEAH